MSLAKSLRKLFRRSKARKATAAPELKDLGIITMFSHMKKDDLTIHVCLYMHPDNGYTLTYTMACDGELIRRQNVADSSIHAYSKLFIDFLCQGWEIYEIECK